MGKTVAVAIAAATLLIVAMLAMKLVSSPGGTPSGQDMARAQALASPQAPTVGPAEAMVHIVDFLDPA